MTDSIKELSRKIHLEFHLEKFKDGDFSYVRKEFETLRDKLASFTPHREDIKEYLHKHMEIDLYEQMLKHDAMEYEELSQLSCFIFYHMKKLCAPSRDKMLDDELDSLILFISTNVNCKISCLVKIIQCVTDICEIMDNDMNSYINSDRAQTDFKILQSESGQKWLKNRNISN